MDDDVFILGEGVEINWDGAGLKQRDRMTKSGNVKSRYTVTIKSEKLIHNFNAKSLGKGPAQAILKLLRERIESISDTAAPNTIRARATAARAVAKGKAWALKRYAGGRTGQMTPGTSDRLFNDSGRFAKTITANGNEDGWTINCAANRLSPDTLDGHASVSAIWDRLVSLVPELADVGLLADSIPVRLAIQEAMDGMIKKASSETAELEAEAMHALIETAIQVFEMIDEAVGA